METFDSEEEWQRLSEYYRQITEEELLALARQYSDLTGVAQQVLKLELSHRALAMPAAPGPPIQNHDPARDSDPDSPYAEDRKLVDIRTVWSRRDALQLQSVLDVAGIPLYMGTEKATRAEAVSSNFSDGVKVQTMRIGVPWAKEALKYYAPEDEPETEEEKEVDEDVAIRCPKCHSDDLVLEDFATAPETTAGSSAKFKWTCLSCNHQWEDDGIEEV
jgi:Zn finger protein HypA/HybF involved in hydrogenase expression